MKLYLSSYKIGNNPLELINLVNKQNAKVAVIDNALDYSDDLQRRNESLKAELDSMKSLGFNPEHVDLRNYFDSDDGLLNKLKQFDAVWVRGGNSFILRKAMAQSRFDLVIEELIKPNKLVYAGYSAALAVISPSLDGVHLVDDPNVEVEGYDKEIIWEGYGLIDFYPIVHYQSNHSESKLVDSELEYVKSKDYPYRTLRDGDSIIIDTN